MLPSVIGGAFRVPGSHLAFCQRERLHDDSVAFMLKDRISLALGLLIMQPSLRRCSEPYRNVFT